MTCRKITPPISPRHGSHYYLTPRHHAHYLTPRHDSHYLTPRHHSHYLTLVNTHTISPLSPHASKEQQGTHPLPQCPVKGVEKLAPTSPSPGTPQQSPVRGNPTSDATHGERLSPITPYLRHKLGTLQRAPACIAGGYTALGTEVQNIQKGHAQLSAKHHG